MMEAKQKELMERARRGVLKFVSDRGGSAHLGDIHEFSEKKYFIAHQGFSRLLDGIVSGGLMAFEAVSNTVTLTEAGRVALNETAPSENT